MAARPNFRIAELAHFAAFDDATQLRRHRLHPVADAEYRHPERPDRGRRARRVALGHAVRPAREHDAAWCECANELVAHVVRVNLAVDVRLAQAPRDELRVLRAEIEDQDPAVRRGSHGVSRERQRVSALTGGDGSMLQPRCLTPCSTRLRVALFFPGRSAEITPHRSSAPL